MKRTMILCSLLALLLSGCGPQEEAGNGKGETVPFETYTYEQLLASTTVGGGSFSPDETRLLIHSNKDGVYNLYSIELETGEWTQLTEGNDTTYALSYMPDGERILMIRDEGGNELFKMYLRQADGTVQRLTESDRARELFLGFNKERTHFFTQNNARDPRYMDVYKWSVETLEPELIYQNDEGYNLASMSDDERYLALIKTNSRYDTDMYLLDREGDGEMQLIGDVADKEVNFFPADFTPDGSALLYTSDEDSEFSYLMRYDLESGEKTEVFRDEWGVSGASYTWNGTYRVITVNSNSTMEFHITNVETGEPYELPALEDKRYLSLSFSPSEEKVLASVGNAVTPSNYYLHAVGNDDMEQLTHNLNPEIKTANLVEPALIEMTARDGLTFWGYLYRPKQANADEKVPALMWIHGGPGGQSTPSYSAEKQFLVNHGYAVFDLNYRGSSGFGRSFSMADDQKHGKEPLWDVIDAKNWLIENSDWVDPERIGILGGSYGGYMTMAALAFEPEEFAVGVNIFGVTNWVRTLKSIPAWWESFREGLYREMGNPETQEAMLYEISPLFHADKVERPVLVLQGANDPRVLQVESDEMVANIEEAGGVVEYVLFDDEGHGFTKNENRIVGWNAILGFLDTYLKDRLEAPENEEVPDSDAS